MGNIATGRVNSVRNRGIWPSSFATVSVDSAIDFLAVRHLDNQDEQNLVLNLVDRAVVLSRPDVHPVELLFDFESFHAMGTRVVLQAEEIPVDLLPDVWVESADVPLG
jgi:hypothetical protein